MTTVIDLRDKGRRQRAIEAGMNNVFRGLQMMEQNKARERALKRQQQQDQFVLLATAQKLGTTPDKLLTPEGQKEALLGYQAKQEYEKTVKQQKEAEKEQSLRSFKQQELDIKKDKAKREQQKSEMEKSFKQSQIDLNNAKAEAQRQAPKIKDKQWENATYAQRMADSERILEDLTRSGYKFGSFETALKTDDFGNISFVASRLKNDQDRKYASAVWNWITSKLRKESGAAISAEEFKNDFKIFFPQIGSTAQDVVFKKSQRDIPFIGFREAAGDEAYNRIGERLKRRRAERGDQTAIGGLNQQQVQRIRQLPGAKAALNEALLNPKDPKSQKVFQLLGVNPNQLGPQSR